MLLTSDFHYIFNPMINELVKVNRLQIRNILFNYSPDSQEVIDILNEISEAYSVCLGEIKRFSNLIGESSYSPNIPKPFRLLVNARCIDNKEENLYKEIKLLRSRSCVNELTDDDRENAVIAAVLIRDAAACLVEEISKLK